jgi:hypothetical protein
LILFHSRQISNSRNINKEKSLILFPNDSSAHSKQILVPNDVPASTMHSFLFQLTFVPKSSLLHFHVLTNATSTATGLMIHGDSRQTSLNDITTDVSARTTTMTVTMTHFAAKRTAITKAPQFQLNESIAS